MAREMKDSGVEWLGEIPETWVIPKLLYVLRNKICDGPHETPNYIDEGIPFISIDSLNESKEINFSCVNRYISQEDYDTYSQKTRIEKGDILFSKAATIGKTAIVGDEKFMVWSPLAVIKRDVDIVDNDYLYYLLNCSHLIRHIALSGSMNTQINVGMRELEQARIPLPSLVEQRTIAAVLDRECSRIDGVLEKTRASIEEYKKLKQAVITQAVTKGIRPGRKMKDSGIEWIGEIPEEWEVSRHKYVMHKKKSICEHYNGENIISLTMNGVVIRDLDAGGKMPTTFDGYQYVESEDLLLCLFDIDVTPRCVGLVKNNGLTSPAYSRFIVHDGYYNAYYDYLLRSIDDAKVFVHLSKNLRSSLTETDFGALPTIVPPLEEQIEISNYLNKTITEIDGLISKKEHFLSEIESYKKSLIYEYVTGKKEV